MKKILFLAFINGWIITFAQDKVYKQQHFLTNVFIHTSKPTYLLGEKIWLSAYLTNAATNQLLVNKHPLYIQLYAPNGNLVSNEAFYTNAGRGSGFISLPSSAQPGIYRLQALTQSMVLAKQKSYEKLIYIGLVPPSFENNNKNKPDEIIYVSTEETTYSKRSPVEVFLESDNELEATLSISVYRESYKQPSNTINFNPKVPKGELTVEETDEQILFMGTALRENGSAIVNGQVILLFRFADGQKTFMANTDSTGYFIFNNLDFEGEKVAYWQVNNTKGKPISDAIINWIKFPRIPLKIDSVINPKEPIQILQQPAVFKSDGDSLNLDDSKMLEEVTVKAKKQEVSTRSFPVLHKDTDVSFAVNFEENQLLPNDAEGKNFKLMLKYLPSCAGLASDPPKYLIDGIVINSDPHEVVDLRQIKRIELLRGANAMVYGSTCVYAIYTHGVEKYTSKPTTPAKTIILHSYQPKRDFYISKYENKNETEQDNRQTLYWNPELNLRLKQNEIPIRFFASDVSGNYKVVVQGMSNLGLIYAESSFIVE